MYLLPAKAPVCGNVCSCYSQSEATSLQTYSTDEYSYLYSYSYLIQLINAVIYTLLSFSLRSLKIYMDVVRMGWFTKGAAQWWEHRQSQKQCRKLTCVSQQEKPAPRGHFLYRKPAGVSQGLVHRWPLLV